MNVTSRKRRMTRLRGVACLAVGTDAGVATVGDAVR